MSLPDNTGASIKKHFFLCHYSNDKEEIKKIRDKLEKRWLWCWLDEAELIAGDDLLKTIEKGIDTSYIFLVFMTKNFIESGPGFKENELNCIQKKALTTTLGPYIEEQSPSTRIIIVCDKGFQKEAESAYPLLMSKRHTFLERNIEQDCDNNLIDKLEEIVSKLDLFKYAMHHLIIENDEKNTFAQNLRDSLRDSLIKLGRKGKNIGLVHDYFAKAENLDLGNPPNPKQVLDAMFDALVFFLDSNAKFAYIVMPQEPEWATDFLEKVKEYQEQEHYEPKVLFCFECGEVFDKPCQELQNQNIGENSKFNPPIKFVSICTSYKEATSMLFDWFEKNLTSPKQIIIIPGPRHSHPADERLKYYLEKIQEKYLAQERTDDDKSGRSKKATIDPLLSLLILNIGTWKQDTAKDHVKACFNEIKAFATKMHTVFICANDSVALGVLEALSQKWKSGQNKNSFPKHISILGFDRSNILENILNGKFEEPRKEAEIEVDLYNFLKAYDEKGYKLDGTTFKTNFSKLAKRAVDYYVSGKVSIKHIKFYQREKIKPASEDLFVREDE